MNKDAVAEMSQQYQVEAAQKLVPKGYKQTEVGVIPEDWGLISLSEIVAGLDSGVSVNSVDEISAFHHNKHILKTSCVDNGYFYQSEKKSILPGEVKRAKCSPLKGSIIVSRMNTPNLVGELGYVPKSLPDMFLPDRLWQMSFKNNIELCSRWLAYLLSSSSVSNRIKESATGTSGSMKNIAKNSFLSLKIPEPSKIEQIAIANFLSDTDALLSELEKLIAKKQAIKTATMQQLLTGRTRLPQFAHHPDGSKKGYKQSELGEIPEDWELIELGELLSYEQPTRYLVDSSEYFENGTVPVLTAGKTFILGYTAELDNLYTNLPVIIFDDFTTASKYVDFPFKAKSSAMKMLRPKNEHLPLALIYSALNSIEFKIGDHKRHWISEFSKLKIKWPRSNEEQTAIATILADMDEEIQALEQRLNKTRQIKQGMMQELLTGKTRLIKSKEARL